MTGRSTVTLVLHTLLRANTWLLWTAGVLAVTFSLIGVGADLAGSVEQSVWEDATSVAPWPVFAGGIITALTLPLLVAHGVTRSTVALAGGLVAPIVAVVGALCMAGGYLLERAVFASADLPARLTDTHLFDRTSQVHLILAEYAVLFAGYFLSGWLVATAYHRLGGLGGTLCLPLALLPLAGVEVAVDTYRWQGGFPGWHLTGAPALPSVAAGVAVVLAAWLVVRVVTRRHPV